jgi:NAD(P)-dependent dehydrogenase (short-subunit alcohol dehydrogenase family)
MFDLKNKTALVTGGGSGIGAAVCLALARQGAGLYIIDLDEAQASQIAGQIKKNNGSAVVMAGDVAKQQQVLDIAGSIGKIDILVTCAGISHIGNAENTSEADFDKIYNVNIKGTYNCLHAVVPVMKNNGGGVIVNMSSIAAKVGLADRFAYSMSKGAVYAMTLSVARDYINDNIRCNCVSPARVHTPFVDNFLAKNYPGKEQEIFDKLSRSQPIGRMGKPAEIADLILYLCSDEAAFITGSDFPVDGGFITLNT